MSMLAETLLTEVRATRTAIDKIAFNLNAPQIAARATSSVKLTTAEKTVLGIVTILNDLGHDDLATNVIVRIAIRWAKDNDSVPYKAATLRQSLYNLHRYGLLNKRVTPLGCKQLTK